MDPCTRVLHLWLSNDEGTYFPLVGIAKAASNKDQAETRLQETVTDWVEFQLEKMEQPIGGMIRDLVYQALGQVDWSEIADDFWQEDEEDDEPEA